MKSIVPQGKSLKPSKKGLFLFKHGLYMSEGSDSYKITNVINKTNPYSISSSKINDYSIMTNMASSQTSLDNGTPPDIITTNSPVIQPRKGFFRVWKTPDNSTAYIQFLDVYNGVSYGRPTESIARALSKGGATWDTPLKYPLNFFREDGSLDYVRRLLNSYITDKNNNFVEGVLEYQGENLNLLYIDMAMSWCRIMNDETKNQPWDWVYLDNGYTGDNWIPIEEGRSYAKWTKTTMASKFASQYNYCSNNMNNIINNPTYQVYTNGSTIINLGIGDISMVVEKSETKMMVAFNSQNDIPDKKANVICKVSNSQGIKHFTPSNSAVKSSDISFSENTKIEVMIYRNSKIYKKEVFIDYNNLRLSILSKDY